MRRLPTGGTPPRTTAAAPETAHRPHRSVRVRGRGGLARFRGGGDPRTARGPGRTGGREPFPSHTEEPR